VTEETSIAFVVVPDHEQAKRLSEDVRPWLEQGLVRPFIVAAVADIPGGEDPLGRWISADDRGEQVVSCYRALAARDYSMIRVVAYQELRRGEAGDPHTVAAARTLGESFQFRKAASQQLSILNVLVPDDRVRDLPPDLLLLSVSANVVVAPEDRESPKHASFPLDGPDRARNHGLASLFVLAALWRHQQNGPLDEEQTSSFNEVPHVVMVRSYGRIARAPLLVERIARSVFTQRRTAQWAAEAVTGVQARDPEQIARRQAERFLEVHKSAFTFQPPTPPVAPRPRTVRVLEAFAMMFGYILRGLRSLPSEVRGQVSEAARRAVGEFAQSVTFGTDSRVRVHGSPGLSGETPDIATAMSDLAAVLLERSGGSSPTPPATGDPWQDLRAVAFAMHDGSEFPAGFERPSDGVITEVIADVRAIAPDPMEGPFTVASDVAVQIDPFARVPIRSNDAMQAAYVEEELATLEDAREVERLRDWVAHRKTSFVWRLANHVAVQFQAAEQVLGRSLQRVRQGAANLDGSLVQQARQQLLRSWWIWLALVVAVSGGGYLYLRQQGLALTGRELAIYVAVSVLVWLAGWTFSFIRYLRRLFQIEHRRDRENADYHSAVSSTFHAASHLVRLGAIYQQLQDWGEIVGWVLHHPEGELGDEEEEVDVETGLATPASHRVGQACWDEGSLRRLAAIVGRNLFGRSWLSNLFVSYRDIAMAQLKYELGYDAAVPDPDPDWDVRSPGPRPFLLSALERRQLARAWTQQSMGIVRQHLNEIDPNDLLDLVKDEQGAASAAEFLYGILADRRGHVEPADVALPLWTNEARMYERQRVVSTVLWSSNPLPDDVVGAVEGHVARSDVTERSVHDVLVVRTDRCAPAPYTDLKLFVSSTPDVGVVHAPSAGSDEEAPW
jgi:hypothetical protein